MLAHQTGFGRPKELWKDHGMVAGCNSVLRGFRGPLPWDGRGLFGCLNRRRLDWNLAVARRRASRVLEAWGNVVPSVQSWSRWSRVGGF